MHEVAICESVLRTMRQVVAEHRYRTVHSVTLHVGALQLVVPDALDFAFGALTRGSEFQDTELVLEVVPARGRCAQCGLEQERESLFSPCADCGGYRFEMVSGMELTIAQMEVDADV